MIQYLSNREIDKQKWDDCIAGSVNRRVYAFSWYLDIVCPGWDGLIEADYRAVFPLTHHRKWGIRYLFQPFFTQQLGLFSTTEKEQGLVGDFIDTIASRYRFAEIHLNSMNKYQGNAGETINRTNFELDLERPYHELTGRYAQDTARNIRKAVEKGIIVDERVGVDELISLFRENFGKTEGKLKPVHYATIGRLMQYGISKQTGTIVGARTTEGNLSAAAFFLSDGLRRYFLFAASAPEARENGAMFRLVDQYIANHAGQSLTLDFEGGNDSGIGRFYKGFGAHEVNYPMVRINRLPAMTEKGLYFVRRLKNR